MYSHRGYTLGQIDQACPQLARKATYGNSSIGGQHDEIGAAADLRWLLHRLAQQRPAPGSDATQLQAAPRGGQIEECV